MKATRRARDHGHCPVAWVGIALSLIPLAAGLDATARSGNTSANTLIAQNTASGPRNAPALLATWIDIFREDNIQLSQAIVERELGVSLADTSFETNGVTVHSTTIRQGTGAHFYASFRTRGATVTGLKVDWDSAFFDNDDTCIDEVTLDQELKRAGWSGLRHPGPASLVSAWYLKGAAEIGYTNLLHQGTGSRSCELYFRIRSSAQR
jgi:hypothetical protein